MFLKSKSGRLIEVPTPEEGAAINAGIAADPDTYELTDEEFARLKPMRGRPVSATPKVQPACGWMPRCWRPLNPGGRGWQTRIKEALKEWLKTHSAA